MLCVSGPRANGRCWEWIWSGWWRGIICGIMGLYVMLYRDVTCLESPDTAAWFKQEIRVFVAVQKIFQASRQAYPFSCTRGKATRVLHWPSTPSSDQVKERVNLCLSSPSGPSWPVLGWTLPLPLILAWMHYIVVCHTLQCFVCWMWFL